MQKIVPHLWYDTEAVEAASFYVSLFPDSRINWTMLLENTPGGDNESISFTLAGMDFMAISGGPFFKLNPSANLCVNCSTVEEVDELYEKLVEGGSVLTELDAYPFSQRYACVTDRFGLSWQLVYGESGFTQKIIPTLVFAGEHQGQAEAAVDHYLSIFAKSSKGAHDHYDESKGANLKGQLEFALFTLEGTVLGATDSDMEQTFAFSTAFSIMVLCENQEEIDYYWEKLSAVPEAEQCGWLEDKFGVTWQVTPRVLDEMLLTDDAEQKRRVMEAFLPMKKLDLAAIQRAYDGT